MFDLLKFTSKERYADDLLSGKLYMNPLSFFKKLSKKESRSGQQDSIEGFVGYISKSQITNYFIYDPMFDLAEKIIIINDSIDFFNIFCMYMLHLDNEKKVFHPISEELLKSDTTLGSWCVYISDSNEFISRLSKAIKKKCDEQELSVAIWGPIQYAPIDEDIGDRSIFNKNTDYQYQNEWRIAVASIFSLDTPIILEIGDIRDIARKIPLDSLSKEISDMYPTYKPSEERVYSSDSGLTMYGNYTITNFFLNSFMPMRGGTKRLPSEIQIVKNTAENYWLRMDVNGGIKYLQNEIKKTKKIEILKLYRDYLIRARKVYKDKLFTDLIQELMKDKEFGLSRDGYLIMVFCNKLYPNKRSASVLLHAIDSINGLSEIDKKDVRLFVSSVLECYDQLDYCDERGCIQAQNLVYAILKNLYTLQWEEALHLFHSYANDVFDLLHGFRGLTYQIGVLLNKGVPQENTAIEDIISGICSEARSEKYICTNDTGDCLIGVRLLLHLALNNNLNDDLFIRFHTIYITPVTVRVLIDWYTETGNDTIYLILSWLRENKNKLTFISPDLFELAALYCTQPKDENDNLLNRLVFLRLKMRFEEL